MTCSGNIFGGGLVLQSEGSGSNHLASVGTWDEPGHFKQIQLALTDDVATKNLVSVLLDDLPSV